MSATLQTRTDLQDADRIPLDQIDVSRPELFRDDTLWGYFARLRKEDPVHYCRDSQFGPYWSVTRFQDILYVDSHPELFSSQNADGGITIMSDNAVASLPMFIALDPPRHGPRRAAVSPIVAPTNLANLEGLIRERTHAVVQQLPVGETFDWVEQVSIDLTTKMLATLFDFPWEDRHLLTYWSDVATTLPGAGGVIETEEERFAVMKDCAGYMSRLFNERRAAGAEGFDVLSMMARAENTANMTPEEFLGDMFLLIVGGNDTTRNSMSGSVVAFDRFPGEYRKLCDNHALLASAVSEIIRWHTPLAHMRRNATQDVELGGKTIRKGDKVVMWYVSGNRDESVVERADDFIIDRQRPRHHLSFGFGIHRCVGNRLGEMQLQILWQELLARFPRAGQIRIDGTPERVNSNFIRGYTHLPVRIDA